MILEETRRALPLGSVENLDQSQKSDGAGSYTRCRWNILRPASENASGSFIGLTVEPIGRIMTALPVGVGD
jgi:hypothetical protein